MFPGKTPGPVVFVLETLPHDRFQRRGADLLTTPRIPLHEALSASPIRVTLLDGTTLTVPNDDIVTPGYRIAVPGRGMPNPEEGAGARGDLVLSVDVLFPKKLSEAQKAIIAAAVFLPESKETGDAVKDFRLAFEHPVTGWKSGVV